MQSTEAFWNKIAPKYARSPVPNEQVYTRKLELTQSYLKPDMRVLEFGCGTGTTALHHAPFVKEYIATDIAQEMIRIAEQKRSDSGVANVRFSVGTINSAWEGKQQFDAVLGLNVLHLLPDWRNQIETIHRLLPAGGLFITSTGCLKEKLPWSWLRFVAPLLRTLRVFPTVAFFTKREFRDCIVQTGFEVVHDWTPESSPITSFLVCRKNAEDSVPG